MGLILNGVVQDAHGPDSHPNRPYHVYLAANRFEVVAGAVFGLTDGLVRWRFPNGVDSQVVAVLELPPNFVDGEIVGIRLMRCLFLEPAGAVGAGNARLGYGTGGLMADLGTAPGISAPSTAAIAIPAEAGATVLRELTPAIQTLTTFAGHRLMSLAVRREANQAGDTFEDLLDFLGASVEIVLDQ